MDFMFDLPLIGPFLGVVLPFLLVLGVVIFVHEYGHYIVGRWSGIYAEVFSVGFGREIVGWTDRRGTRWRICWVPLGGYVKFKGDSNVASASDSEELEGMSPEERRSTLGGAPLWARAATVAAGPVANFILTIVMIFVLSLVIGRPSEAPVLGEISKTGQAYGGGLRAGDRIVSVDGAPIDTFSGFAKALSERENETRRIVVERPAGVEGAPPTRETLSLTLSRLTEISNVTPGRPASKACIRRGDIIMQIDGANVATVKEIQEAVKASGGEEVSVTLKRGQQLITKTLKPELTETPDPQTGGVTQRMLIGVEFASRVGIAPEYEPQGPLGALEQGLAAPWGIITTTFGYLGQIFAGESDGSSLRGPLGIAEISGQAAAQGVFSLLTLVAVLSTAIGLMNLFPIPILDGGHLVFYGIEAVRGEPLPQKAMEAAMAAGFFLLIALLVFATRNDVIRIYYSLTSGC